jgi:hypothetical protein
MITYDIVPFFLLLLFPMPITTRKKKILFGLYEKINIFLKTGHLIIGLHSNACSKDSEHSQALVCTRGVFSYQVMTSGGHVYPNDKEKQDSMKRKTQR